MSKFAFLFLFISISTHATLFRPQGLEEQIKEADGIVLGHFLESKVIELESGRIATQAIFKLNKEYGFQSDLFGMDEVIVHFPGGTLGDKTVKVEGVPNFVSGEKVALFVSNVQNRYWGLNLGMGTFKVINYGKETILVNSLMPENPNIGQIKLYDFERAVKNVKGSSLKIVHTPIIIEENDGDPARFPASEEEGKIRSIASHSISEENVENRPSISTYWLVMILAVLGGLYRFFRQKA